VHRIQNHQRASSSNRSAHSSRARKSADYQIQAEKPGQCDKLRRAVDCAPYLILRLRAFALKMRTYGAMCPYQRNKISLGGGTSPMGSGRFGRATVIVPWRAALLAAVTAGD